MSLSISNLLWIFNSTLGAGCCLPEVMLKTLWVESVSESIQCHFQGFWLCWVYLQNFPIPQPHQTQFDIKNSIKMMRWCRSQTSASTYKFFFTTHTRLLVTSIINHVSIFVSSTLTLSLSLNTTHTVWQWTSINLCTRWCPGFLCIVCMWMLMKLMPDWECCEERAHTTPRSKHKHKNWENKNTLKKKTVRRLTGIFHFLSLLL